MDRDFHKSMPNLSDYMRREDVLAYIEDANIETLKELCKAIVKRMSELAEEKDEDNTTHSSTHIVSHQLTYHDMDDDMGWI